MITMTVSTEKIEQDKMLPPPSFTKAGDHLQYRGDLL